ncbi:cartilage matrix protein isoform X3 [Bubalus bubalis]|nr:cartilage matrix protein isoform X3 [Bubalus bubalis]
MEEETPRSPSQMEEHLAMPLTQKNPFSSSTIQVLFLGPDIGGGGSHIHLPPNSCVTGACHSAPPGQSPLCQPSWGVGCVCGGCYWRTKWPTQRGEGGQAFAHSSSASQVVIVVTDGRPQDSVRDVSARARAGGIELFAIGVGRVDKATLQQIASEPQDEHVDYVESYSVIEKLSKKFQEAFCLVSDLCATGDHDCEQVCVSSPGSYTCACREGFTLNSDGKTCNVCNGGGGSSATDLVFLIDGSKSVRPENFELVKKFINQIVDTLDVSDKLAQVGLVQYSSSVRQEFPLGRFHTKKDIKAAVRNMSYMEKGTMTGAALKYLIDNSFTVSSGARPGAQKVGIVFTDGRSQDYINDAAKKAKDLGFKMFAVGVGNAVEDELREIASEPVAEHYFYTADFKTINQIGKKLQKRICVASKHVLNAVFYKWHCSQCSPNVKSFNPI